MERTNITIFTIPRSSRALRSRNGPKFIDATFSLDGPAAQEVYLCGDFNQWLSAALGMTRHPGNGQWEARLTLKPGQNQHKLIVDGEWCHHPEAFKNDLNSCDSLNSAVEFRP